MDAELKVLTSVEKASIGPKLIKQGKSVKKAERAVCFLESTQFRQ
jgi:hypothetical protein